MAGTNVGVIGAFIALAYLGIGGVALGIVRDFLGFSAIWGCVCFTTRFVAFVGGRQGFLEFSLHKTISVVLFQC